MKALKGNCKVPFLIGGYFCSESRGDFNGLYFTRALISSRTIPGLVPAYSRRTRYAEKERGKQGGQKGRKERRRINIAMDSRAARVFKRAENGMCIICGRVIKSPF